MKLNQLDLLLPTRKLLVAASCFALLATVFGCGSSGPEMIPIRGEVIYGDEPLKEGQVVYIPVDLSVGRQASGSIQPDGTFEMMTKTKADGVIVGEYRIAIYAYKPHPGEPSSREEHEAMAKAGTIERGFLIPEKYADPNTSELTDKVDSSHSGVKRIEIPKIPK